VDVQIDEAGSYGEAGGVENLGVLGVLQLAGAGDLGDAAVPEENVLEGVDATGGVDQVAATNY
jgi:hypothetical protein